MERLYTEAKLPVRRRRRKKIPLADRQPLLPTVESSEWPLSAWWQPRLAGAGAGGGATIWDSLTLTSAQPLLGPEQSTFDFAWGEWGVC